MDYPTKLDEYLLSPKMKFVCVYVYGCCAPTTKWRSFQLMLHQLLRLFIHSYVPHNSPQSKGVSTCHLGTPTVIMRNARIALNVMTFYLGFGVNQVGAFAPTDNYNMIYLLHTVRPKRPIVDCLHDSNI